MRTSSPGARAAEVEPAVRTERGRCGEDREQRARRRDDGPPTPAPRRCGHAERDPGVVDELGARLGRSPGPWRAPGRKPRRSRRAAGACARARSARHPRGGRKSWRPRTAGRRARLRRGTRTAGSRASRCRRRRDRVSADLLRRDVVERPEQRSVSRRRGGSALREPEVAEIAVPAFVEEHVRGLDVPVDETAGVRRVERVCDLRHDLERPRRGQRALSPEERAKVRPRDVAHGEEEAPVGLAGVVDRHHVRVIEARRELRLAEQPLAERRRPRAPGARIFSATFRSRRVSHAR